MNTYAGLLLAVTVGFGITRPLALFGADKQEGSPSNTPVNVGNKLPAPCMQITPFEFGAVGDGVADDTKALQSAVDAAIARKILLTSPMSAVYAVTAPIEIRGTLNADFNFAEIRATARMPAVIRYETPKYYTLLRNLRVDGNLMADVCISIVRAQKMRLDNMVAGRHLNTALKIAHGYEIFVQNSHFNGAAPDDINREAAENTVGIDISTSDCHFSDIVIIDCKTAIANRGFNFYERIHAWTYKPAIIKDSVCFDLWSNCIISDSYADTFQTCFRLRHKGIQCKLSGCGSYYNERLYKADRGHVTPYLFWVDEGNGHGVSIQSSIMRATEAMGGHYSNVEKCAVYTDGSDSFVRWTGAPEY